MLLRQQRLATSEGMHLDDFHCLGRTTAWSPERASATYGLCLMRVGGSGGRPRGEASSLTPGAASFPRPARRAGSVTCRTSRFGTAGSN